jgi:hypothetical protein
MEQRKVRSGPGASTFRVKDKEGMKDPRFSLITLNL